MSVKRVMVAISVLMLSAFSAVTAMSEDSAAGGPGARQTLLEGNKRYVEARLSHPDQTTERRVELETGQHPFAVILSCSDSRVPPEVIFDQGLGDLFVIRLAGNIVDDAALGSIEYAVEHLGVKYVMVLGHERCGAVDATVKGGEAPGHIATLVKAIQPALEKARKQQGDLLDNTVRANALMVAQQLRSSGPILAGSVKKGELTIEAARYDLDEGVVTLLP
jgi:carbonic anhydrase